MPSSLGLGTRIAAMTALVALSAAGCSGSSSPGASSPPAVTATSQSPSTATAAASDPLADAQFAAQLAAQLRPPALPSFTIPTDLLDSPAGQRIAQQLELQPGLYEGIAVLSQRCTTAGDGHSADAGAATTSGNGTYKKDDVEVTVKQDGTGVYNAPGVHIAVLPGGAGVYEHDGQRLSVQPGGGGTWVSGIVRLTVRGDGSGTYSNGLTRFWVGSNGAGGYRDAELRISVSATGVVSGNGSPGQQAAVRRQVEAGLSRLGPVPAIRRVKPSGTVCGTVIRLDANVLFDFGSAQLRPEARTLVDRVATLLTVVKPAKLTLNGYTDQIGGEADNLRLSQSRAEAVAAELSAHGVPDGVMTSTGLGESDPLRPEKTASGADDPAARQLNRRVEIVVPIS